MTVKKEKKYETMREKKRGNNMRMKGEEEIKRSRKVRGEEKERNLWKSRE